MARVQRLSMDFEPSGATVSAYLHSKARRSFIEGPLGCISGDTLVVTESGAVPICRLTRPVRVLSWNEKTCRFELSLCGGSFPKGKDYLYRVSTPAGEFVAAGFHQVLCADGDYRRVDALSCGRALALCGVDHPSTTAASAPLTSHADDPHLMQRLADSMGRYAESARRYGLQFLLVEDTGPAFAQERGGVQGLISYPGLSDFWHTDGRSPRSPERIHTDQFCDPTQTGYSALLVEPRSQVGGIRAQTSLVERISRSAREVSRFLGKRVCRLKDQLFSARSGSYALSERTILAIERLQVKQSYWDLQVLDTSNYVTADGTIHHNSGKTFTSAMKALKVVTEQEPGPDGVRRTAGLVTRTASTELEMSALKDWLDLTEGKFHGALGKFNWASPRKHELRFKLPDQTMVESDIWFVGLDEPDGVRTVRGMPLTFAWLNETKDFSFALVQMVFGRCGRYPRMEDGGPTWSGMFGDTNMPFIGHWLHKLAEEERPAGWEFFRQPGGVVKVDGKWIPNPDAENLDFLPPGYYEEQLSGAEENWISVYLGANYGFTLDGTPVFPEYNDQMHCAKVEPIRSVPLQRGWDWGLTPACAFSQILPDGRWAVVDELTTDDVGMSADEFADDVLDFSARNYPGFEFEDTGDPAGEQRAQTDEKTCFQIVKKKGIKIKPGKQDLALRLESVKRPLRTMKGGRPMFVIDPKCIMLRRGFMGGYRYRKMRTATTRFVGKPEKNELSHVMDGLGYTATRLFGGLLVEKEIAKPQERHSLIRTVSGSQAWMG